MEVLENGSNGSKRFLISIDTQRIVTTLTEAEGGFVSYDLLTSLIGRDVRTKARHCLNTAQRILLRDHDELWVAEHGKGVKRLSDAEKVSHGGKRVRHINRTAKRGARELTSVKDFDALKPEEKQAHNFNLSVLGALNQMTSAPRVRALKKRMEPTRELLPLAKTLELFT